VIVSFSCSKDNLLVAPGPTASPGSEQHLDHEHQYEPGEKQGYRGGGLVRLVRLDEQFRDRQV